MLGNRQKPQRPLGQHERRCQCHWNTKYQTGRQKVHQILMCFTTTSAARADEIFKRYRERERGRCMVVCHGLGAPYFTVYVLSCGTEHERKATGVEGEEERENMENPLMTQRAHGAMVRLQEDQRQKSQRKIFATSVGIRSTCFTGTWSRQRHRGKAEKEKEKQNKTCLLRCSLPIPRPCLSW